MSSQPSREPCFSVIVPYAGDETLALALQGLLRQSLEPHLLELILVVDGEADVEEIKERVQR